LLIRPTSVKAIPKVKRNFFGVRSPEPAGY